MCFCRSTLVLMKSADLRSWELRYVLLYHSDVTSHGFQYVDWIIDDDDLLFVSRTAWEDDAGGAPNQHDANFMTFHRLDCFRTVSLAESAKNPFSGT